MNTSTVETISLTLVITFLFIFGTAFFTNLTANATVIYLGPVIGWGLITAASIALLITFITAK